MTKETIDSNQTDPIKTVPSHFQADTSTANITYQYTIIRFRGADQQSINSLASSHKAVPHNNYSVPMSTCTHGYRTFVAELFLSSCPSLHCPSHARLHNSISTPNRVCNTVTDSHNNPEFVLGFSCCTVSGALEEDKLNTIPTNVGRANFIFNNKRLHVSTNQFLGNKSECQMWSVGRTSVSDLAPVNKLSVG